MPERKNNEDDNRSIYRVLLDMLLDQWKRFDESVRIHEDDPFMIRAGKILGRILGIMATIAFSPLLIFVLIIAFILAL